MPDFDFNIYRIMYGVEESPVIVGAVTSDIARALNASVRRVYLSREDAQKIRFKHNLADRDHTLIPHTIRYGWAGIERHRPRHALIVYESPAGKLFKAVVKVTGERHELYLETFHRCDATLIRSAVKRCHMVRRQVIEEE